MGRVAGLQNQPSLCWICWRMQRVTLRYAAAATIFFSSLFLDVSCYRLSFGLLKICCLYRLKAWMSTASTFHTSRWTKPWSRGVVHTVLTDALIVSYSRVILICLFCFHWQGLNWDIYSAFLGYRTNIYFMTAYMSNPCHIELILSEKEEPVKKEVCSFIESANLVKHCFGQSESDFL